MRTQRVLAAIALAIIVGGPTVFAMGVLSFIIGPFCLLVPVFSVWMTRRALRRAKERVALRELRRHALWSEIKGGS